MRLKNARRSIKAFTLIELLLGLSIFSIIALCVYSTFSGGIRLAGISQDQTKIYRDIRLTLNLIEKELENAVGYDFSGSYPEIPAFKGDSDQITFLLGSDEGLKAVSYYLVPPESGTIHKILIGKTHSKNIAIDMDYRQETSAHYLVRKERSFADYVNNDRDENAEVEIISMEVERDGIQFRFGYEESEADGTLSWTNNWDSKGIPRFVTVEINFILDEKKDRIFTVKKDMVIPSGTLVQEES